MINELLNIKYPIFCGAMSRITLSNLVSAVGNAGAIGFIASGAMNKEELRKEIRKVKELSNKPFGVNLFLKSPVIDDLVDIVIEEKVSVVTTGAGSPKKFIEKLKKANIIIIPVVPDEITAKKMEDLGCDAVVVEGMEAGGHIGEISTLVAVKSVLNTVKIPVIAAGGISDGQTVAALLTLGCSGVQIGSRFLLANECEIDKKYKDIVINSKDTITTGRTLNTPVRCIPNKMTEEFISLEKENIMDKEKLEALTLGSLEKAVQGDIENGSLMAGQIIRVLNKKESVNDIIQSIVKQTNETLKKASKIKMGE